MIEFFECVFEHDFNKLHNTTTSSYCFVVVVVLQVMLQYLDKLQKEDMENLIKKREMQRGLMKDVAKANEVCSIPSLSFEQDVEYSCFLVS